MPGPNVDYVLAKYGGSQGPTGMASRTSISSTAGLKGKLSELAGQLAAVQSENEAIRGRYLELEDAWEGMIEENKRVHSTNETLRDHLEECEESCAAKDQKITALEARTGTLAAELERQVAIAKKATADLKTEQMKLGKKNLECDMLRRESMNLDMEGRKLREDWDDKFYKLQKAEEARDHYKVELHKLSTQYGELVEKLSFVTSDYTVRTSSTMVQGRNGLELLSTYLNRIYDEQETTNSKYARIGAINLSRK